jgi:hypothetical protein
MNISFCCQDNIAPKSQLQDQTIPKYKIYVLQFNYSKINQIQYHKCITITVEKFFHEFPKKTKQFPSLLMSSIIKPSSN